MNTNENKISTQNDQDYEGMFEVIEDSFIDNRNIAEMNAATFCCSCCSIA